MGSAYLNWSRRRRFVHRIEKSPTSLVADARAQGAEHFAVTGDLANLGLAGGVRCGSGVAGGRSGAADQVTVVPGNHDIYTARHARSVLPRQLGGVHDVLRAGAGVSRRQLGDGFHSCATLGRWRSLA